MEPSKKTGNLHYLFRGAFTTKIRRVDAPSFHEVREYRRSGAERERIQEYADGHPGFALVLEMLESDDEAEGDGDSPSKR